jgi:hypothetical protein
MSGRISKRVSGPSSILTIRVLSVDVRVSLPTRCSMRNSWKAEGEALRAVTNGDASSALMRSQKPESSLRSGVALWPSALQVAERVGFKPSEEP